ncbi:MAG: pyruvate ferredoxin oxidoreductase [Chloroflexi bacterium]|nr:pyruvate ferredoxin oxidoreductase [Chloroflexota bacterium]MCL5074080.1 pyruvate ferredoxin oxidoreductase [Chloroflexota bacterium]
MGKKVRISGCKATAEAVKAADVDVICSYPIRPYTGTMIELARMVAEGELDAEFVHGEGEHAQLSVVLGASAAGARVFTGSAGVGITYAFELYSPIAGEFHPVQCMIADRTLDPPGDFGSEHTDALSTRDQGWIMGWAATPQEAYDNTLVYYRLGEDPRVMLPQFPCQDGYFVSHISGEVELAEPGQVEAFLPPFRPKHSLDPENPVLMGPQCRADQGAAIQLGRTEAMKMARQLIPEIYADFNRIFGRRYAPFLEGFMTEDADVIFFGQGAHTVPARLAAQRLRQEGLRIGVIQLRFMRPFPTEEVATTLSRFKVVGVLENCNSFGSAHNSGPLTMETLASLYYAPEHPKVLTFLSGLGGENIRLSDYYSMARAMQEALQMERLSKRVFWLGFEPLQVKE